MKWILRIVCLFAQTASSFVHFRRHQRGRRPNQNVGLPFASLSHHTKMPKGCLGLGSVRSVRRAGSGLGISCNESHVFWPRLIARSRPDNSLKALAFPFHGKRRVTLGFANGTPGKPPGLPTEFPKRGGGVGSCANLSALPGRSTTTQNKCI